MLVRAGVQAAADPVGGLSAFVQHAVLLLASVLVVVAIAIVAVAMCKRLISASLVVRPFIDDAIEVKVGPGVASLVEERLMGALRRKGRGEETYDLDRVAIDIELLAGDKDLSKAITQLVDVPQLKVVGALMALIERMLPSRGLSATGELLPAGSEGIGAGVSLALYKGSRLVARSSLWETEVKLWLPGATPEQEEEKKEKKTRKVAKKKLDGSDPSPHYGLAAAAAWWVQYEAGQVFDRNVSLVTKSAPSFSLVGIALASERKDEPREAADAYARALALDPDNVAALFNLALLLARQHECHAPAALLLVRAQKALEDRHQWQKRSSPESQLQDPTWYRIRYALAVQCLQLAVGEDEGSKRGDGVGWPDGFSPGSPRKGGRWKDDFESTVEELLVGLAEEGNASRMDKPTELAGKRAGELLATTAKALREAGWRWVGSPRPRYRRGAELLGEMHGGIPWTGRRPERPVASDRKLARFLSEVVEPAAVVLYCATIAQDDGEYERFRKAILEPAAATPARLDRRGLSSETQGDWARSYLSALLAPRRVAEASPAPIVGLSGSSHERRRVTLDPRASYSFACMLSRLAGRANDLGETDDRVSFAAAAALQLERALSKSPSGQRERLAEWAQKDPDLLGLRDCDETGFDAIVAPWGPADRRQLERTQLDSPTISSVAYMSEARVLELQFSDGSRSQYYDVPEHLYEELKSAKLPEQFFADKAKSGFASVRA